VAQSHPATHAAAYLDRGPAQGPWAGTPAPGSGSSPGWRPFGVGRPGAGRQHLALRAALAAGADADDGGPCVCGAQIGELQLARAKHEACDGPGGRGSAVGPVEVVGHAEPVGLEMIVEHSAANWPLTGPGRAHVDGRGGAADQVEIGVEGAGRGRQARSAGAGTRQGFFDGERKAARHVGERVGPAGEAAVRVQVAGELIDEQLRALQRLRHVDKGVGETGGRAGEPESVRERAVESELRHRAGSSARRPGKGQQGERRHRKPDKCSSHLIRPFSAYGAVGLPLPRRRRS